MRILNSAVAVTFVAAFTLAAPIVQAHTLTDALINAYRNSPQLKGEQAALRGTDEGVAQAGAALRPSIVASANSGFRHLALTGTTSQTANLTLSVDLMLWDGGVSELAVQVARHSVGVARQSLVDTEQQVLLNAVIAFMDMRRDAQFLQLAENNRKVIAKQVQAARDRFEVGEVRRTDVSQAEARLAGALSTVALRQGTLEISREAYFVSIGRYPERLQSPPPLPRVPTSLEGAKSVAVRNHPTVLRTQILADIAALNVLRAEAAMKPRIGLSGSVSLNRTVTTGDITSVAISGSVPIYQGGALTSAHRQALALKSKSLSDIQLAGLLVGQNATRFWLQLQIARASIIARQREIRASRTALRGIREEADLGARTTLDVLDAEREMLEAETNLVAVKRDEYVAVYSLLSAMGLLTVKHLQLGIKTYDVNANYDKVSKGPGPTDREKLLAKILTRAGKK